MQESSKRCETVSIVDVDESVRESLATFLRALGLEVRTFSSAECLLESLENEAPGCVICEVHLPGMSGIDLQKSLKGKGFHCPVILLASDATIAETVEAMHLGALDVVEKPFIASRVLTRVRQTMSSSQNPASQRRYVESESR